MQDLVPEQLIRINLVNGKLSTNKQREKAKPA
jgi:hypothetical protein